MSNSFWTVEDREVDDLINDLAKSEGLSRDVAANEAVVQRLLRVDEAGVLRLEVTR